MKCKNCGGELTCKTDGYLCESCGSEFAFCAVYEDIDTYICYIETDETGRRTMDSVMAQEICRTLEQAKIKTFYARISADQLTGDDLEEACKAAMHNAKTVVLLHEAINALYLVIGEAKEKTKQKLHTLKYGAFTHLLVCLLLTLQQLVQQPNVR